jgi:hypothetical protein
MDTRDNAHGSDRYGHLATFAATVIRAVVTSTSQAFCRPVASDSLRADLCGGVCGFASQPVMQFRLMRNSVTQKDAFGRTGKPK